ncbi:hypothetical protein RB619_12020 [Flavobacterium sp. LHD-80]|uniref:hypothetical protein n=1 Tax=Flavobacterium sp. LHD-80 TaxID=3071411 RepID=UPI0027DFBA1E|nr:hypothetical protein [Flavobacterium sp. LHD-80]MDQ6471374.1 hypothetical protein [Flavobacterium sp. LHD-80]
MNKNLKYLLSFFLVFTMIATDCTIDSQSKSVAYYQVSQVASGRELDFATSRLYIFNQLKSGVKTLFLIPVTYIQLKAVFSFKIQIKLKWQKLLHQKINSFLKQAVFANEIITSNISYKSLYTA